MRTQITTLPADEQHLVRKALECRQHAQSPYSNFCVGAAVLATNGLVSKGCNVERANYTSTSHAEQVAIDSLIAQLGPVGIRAIAIAGGLRGKEADGPVWPCGHCRGIIWENCLGNKTVRVITPVSATEVEVATIGELYPKAFGPEDLGIKIGS